MSNLDRDEVGEKVANIVALIPLETGAKLTEIGWEKYGENVQEAIEKLVDFILADRKKHELKARIDELERLVEVIKIETHSKKTGPYIVDRLDELNELKEK